jgi:DNA-binding transcriptional LysR family regulator
VLDDIQELRTFVRIAAAGSLSQAARDMGLALSVVSKRLGSLERRTQTRLIARSTRRLALTDEGTQLFERAQRILAEVDEAETVLSHGRAEPEGVLRVTAPMGLGRSHVSPVCRELAARHVRLSIELGLTDRLVSLIDEGMDVAVRIGAQQDSSLIVRKLAESHRVIVAAPSYIERAGMPLTPADLDQHECLSYGTVGVNWRLVSPGGKTAEMRISSRIRSDNGEVSQDWALSGWGLALKSWVDVEADLAAGRLVHVLPEWRTASAPVCAIFPSKRLVPTRVRLFVDAIAERFASLRSPP